MTYDYRTEVKDDCIRFLEEYKEENEGVLLSDLSDSELQDLYDDAFMSDSVTGNASGSYTFSTWQAEENLLHNWDLIIDSAYESGIVPIIGDGWEYGPEWWDVTIRCYLLSECFWGAVEEIRGDECID